MPAHRTEPGLEHEDRVGGLRGIEGRVQDGVRRHDSEVLREQLRQNRWLLALFPSREPGGRKIRCRRRSSRG